MGWGVGWGAKNCSRGRGGEGGSEFTPRGSGKVLAMLQGDTTSFWVVFTQELEVLAILEGEGHKRFLPCKRRDVKRFTLPW